MKRTVVFAVIVLAVLTASAFGATYTANGTLTVTGTVSPSLDFVFQSVTGGVALTNSGTAAATLAFGTVQAFGTCAPTTGATCTNNLASGNFTVSSPVGFLVDLANAASTNYTLKAQLGSADSQNTWTVGGTTVTNTSAATVTSTGAYSGTATNETVQVLIPYTNNTVLSLNNTINFTVTTN